MKKYRLTKIKIRTREIIASSKNPNSCDENQTPVCPVCHSPLAVALPSAEKTVKELLPAEKDADEETALMPINDFLEQKIK